MTIGILYYCSPEKQTYNPNDYWLKSAEERGITLVHLYEPLFCFTHKNGQLEALYEGGKLPHIDVIISRPSYSAEPGLHVYAATLLEQMGYRIINNRSLFSLSKNKLNQHILLSQAGIPMPKWVISRSAPDGLKAATTLGFPVIAKVPFGSKGTGVFFCESRESLLPLTEYLSIRNNSPFIIEKFIASANRKDIRAFIVGGKIIASMERCAKEGDVRANLSAGGSARVAILSKKEKELVLSAAKVFDLEIAGIDLIRSKRGPLILEVNSCPGLKIIDVTGVDVAGAILDYAKKQVKKTKKRSS